MSHPSATFLSTPPTFMQRYRGPLIALYGFSCMFMGSIFVQAVMKPDMTPPDLDDYEEQAQAQDQEETTPTE
ncbi:MAG: hypothetical protein Q8P67_08055 [archaeon]|nr:hypothetical protein [archaeon]